MPVVRGWSGPGCQRTVRKARAEVRGSLADSSHGGGEKRTSPELFGRQTQRIFIPWRPHGSPQAWTPGVSEPHRFLLVPPWSEAPSLLEREVVGPASDSILFLSLSLSSLLGALEDKGTLCVCVCVWENVCGCACSCVGGGTGRKGHPKAYPGLGWGLWSGAAVGDHGGWKAGRGKAWDLLCGSWAAWSGGPWGTLERPQDSLGSPPLVTPHKGRSLGRPVSGCPQQRPPPRPPEQCLAPQFPHLLLESRSWRQHPSWSPSVMPKPLGTTTPAALGSSWKSFWKGELGQRRASEKLCSVFHVLPQPLRASTSPPTPTES